MIIELNKNMLINRTLRASFNNVELYLHSIHMCNNMQFITNDNETQTTIKKSKQLSSALDYVLLHNFIQSRHPCLHNEMPLTLSITFLYHATP